MKIAIIILSVVILVLVAALVSLILFIRGFAKGVVDIIEHYWR